MEMYLDRYKYGFKNSLLDYEFFSEGPKGIVKKGVLFTLVSANFYNLSFGDIDEKTGHLLDTTVTNNNDSRKVLATIASVVHDFTLKYPNAKIFAKGATPARTRLYRMGITNHLEAIQSDFEIFGLKGITWEQFELRKEYDAFLVNRK